MKRSLFTKHLKQALLAVPASALMLGAAHAGTTVALNFQSWYYDSGSNPQTVGFGAGYQTTGFPVTAKAFGVPASSWFNTDPLPAQAAVYSSSTLFGSTSSLAGGSNTFAGTLTVTVTAPDVWQSAIGEQVSGWNPETVAPGNNEVTWGYLDSNGGQSPTANLTGLAAKFPSGYVVQTIAAEGGVTGFNDVTVSDGVNSSDMPYTTYFVKGTASDGYASGNGTVGLSSSSSTLTGDSLSITCGAQTSGNRSTLAGFIITDQPLVTRSYPPTSLVAAGGSFVLNAVGIGIGNLSYQWQHAGTNLPGATFPSYTNSAAATTDGGSYQLLLTSDAFPSYTANSDVLSVTVVPTHSARTATWDADVTTTGAQDGSGIWNNTTTNWWSGSFDDYWGPADSAVIGAGGAGTYTITLGDSIQANAITFNSGTYTITNAAGETLTLSGNSTITMNVNGTIGCPLTTTNTLIKLGTGKLTQAGALGTAATIVSAGTLEVQKSSGNSPYVVTNGATLRIGYSTGGGYATDNTQIYGDGTAATTGLYLNGGTTFNVSGGLVVNNAPTAIRQYGTGMASLGIFDINSNPGLSITAAASGTTTDPNIQYNSYGYGMVVTTAAGANNATGDLVANGPLNVNGNNGVYGLIKRGLGSMRLNAVATTNNVAFNVAAGSAICGIANCIGTNASLVVGASSTINLNGYSQTVSNATLNGTLKMTINKGGSPNSQVLSVIGGPQIGYNGTLIVTNIGGTLALNDSFKLFDDVYGYSGMFTNIQLPQLTTGLGWSNSLAANGTLYVVVGSTPPSVTGDLAGVTNYAFAGVTQTYTITAAGDPTLYYIWLKNGVTPVGVSSPTLTLPALTVGSSGFYSVIVSNNYGKAYSQSNYLSVAAPGLAAAASVQDAPGAIWPLNETAGPTTYDYSGAGNNATQNGGLVLAVAGPSSPAYQGFAPGTLAYQFDGLDSYINCGTGPSLSGTTDFSLEAWINTTNTATGIIIQQRSPTGFNGEYQLSVNANGTLSFSVYGGGQQFNFSSPVASKYVNDGNWHHVAAVRSGLTGTIYIDGSAVATAAGTFVAPLDPTITTYIGADVRGASTYFGGMLCNVAVYSHALSAARIASHAVAGVNGATPVTITNVAGGFIEDSKPVGTPHNGFNYGVNWYATGTDVVSVVHSGVVQFPLGREITIPANADFNTGTGTICFWVLTAPLPGSGNGIILFDRRTTAGTLMFYDTGGVVNFQAAGGVNGFTAGGIGDGAWHHVAMTYDQSSGGIVSIYIDGNLSGSQANTAAWSWPTNQEIELGRSHDTYWQNFNGEMDDFRIYNRILTSTEVSSVFSSSALVDTSALVLQYNFTTPGVGKSLSWSVGGLQSSTSLYPTAWTTVSNINTTLPYLSPAGLPVTTNTTLFYRVGY